MILAPPGTSSRPRRARLPAAICRSCWPGGKRFPHRGPVHAAAPLRALTGAHRPSYDASERRTLPMPDPAPGPEESPPGQPLDLPLIREFDDRSSLWLLEDPLLLRGLVQILDPHLVERLDFAHARRINRSFVPADLQKEESDLVYTVPFQGSGREVRVYVLLEHQSE